MTARCSSVWLNPTLPELCSIYNILYWQASIFMAEQYDIIIIGTGAGGGTLADYLAQTGKRILVLERGDFLPQEKVNSSFGQFA